MSVFLNPVAMWPIVPKNEEWSKWEYDQDESWNQYLYGWSSVLWPRSRWAPIPVGNAQGSPSDSLSLLYTTWWWSHRTGGATERTQMFGQTLNQSSAIVANATVTMYDQTLGVQVDQQTSDPGGNYLVGSPYGAGRSFVVAYKPGSPDIAGTSQDNLP